MTEEEIMALLTAAAEQAEDANERVATIESEAARLRDRLVIAEEVAQRLPLMEEECNQLLADKTDLRRQLDEVTAERDALRALRDDQEAVTMAGEETVEGGGYDELQGQGEED